MFTGVKMFSICENGKMHHETIVHLQGLPIPQFYQNSNDKHFWEQDINTYKIEGTPFALKNFKWTWLRPFEAETQIWPQMKGL